MAPSLPSAPPSQPPSQQAATDDSAAQVLLVCDKTAMRLKCCSRCCGKLLNFVSLAPESAMSGACCTWRVVLLGRQLRPGPVIPAGCTMQCCLPGQLCCVSQPKEQRPHSLAKHACAVPAPACVLPASPQLSQPSQHRQDLCTSQDLARSQAEVQPVAQTHATRALCLATLALMLRCAAALPRQDLVITPQRQ